MSSILELSRHLSAAFGLRPRADWPDELAQAIRHSNVSGSISEVLADPSRRTQLLSEAARRITVGETHFFRHAAQLQNACEALLRAQASDRRLAIWSAGCASGEEAYSLGMLLYRSFGRRLPERVEITGSDVNPDAVKKARDGVYTTWSFRGTPGWALVHFAAERPAALRLSTPELRSAVSFELASCQARAAALGSESLDLISFRNVAIYMEPQAIDALYTEFARLLRPGALLATGPSDPRPPAHAFASLGFADHAPLYQRKGAKLSPVAPRALARKAPERALPRAQAEHALKLAETLTSAEQDTATAHRLVGQLRLDLDRPEEAIVALRKALFLDPDALLARCFYALALRELGELSQAMVQLQLLVNALGLRGESELLEDGETRAGELLQSVKFLKGEWR